jgi:hypothetical protein
VPSNQIGGSDESDGHRRDASTTPLPLRIATGPQSRSARRRRERGGADVLGCTSMSNATPPTTLLWIAAHLAVPSTSLVADGRTTDDPNKTEKINLEARCPRRPEQLTPAGASRHLIPASTNPHRHRKVGTPSCEEEDEGPPPSSLPAAMGSDRVRQGRMGAGGGGGHGNALVA